MVMVVVVKKRIMLPTIYLFLIYQREIDCWLVVIPSVNVGYGCAYGGPMSLLVEN